MKERYVEQNDQKKESKELSRKGLQALKKWEIFFSQRSRKGIEGLKRSEKWSFPTFNWKIQKSKWLGKIGFAGKQVPGTQ
jgi:hypothetical protein